MQTRREFSVKMTIVTIGLTLPWKSLVFLDDEYGKTLALRKFGKTGDKVSMLGLGGLHLKNKFQSKILVESDY